MRDCVVSKYKRNKRVISVCVQLQGVGIIRAFSGSFFLTDTGKRIRIRPLKRQLGTGGLHNVKSVIKLHE